METDIYIYDSLHAEFDIVQLFLAPNSDMKWF